MFFWGELNPKRGKGRNLQNSPFAFGFNRRNDGYNEELNHNISWHGEWLRSPCLLFGTSPVAAALQPVGNPQCCWQPAAAAPRKRYVQET